MKDVIDSIQTISEYVLLGFVGSIVLSYALVWIHPVKERLSDYHKEVWKFLFDSEPHFTDPHRVTMILGVVGYLFLAGSVTNVIAYWVVEPARNKDLVRLYSSLGPGGQGRLRDDGCTEDLKKEEPGQWQLLRELLRDRTQSDCEKRVYADSLNDLASWRTRAREAADDALDGIIKQIRLARGTSVCALGIVVLACLKILSALGVICATFIRIPRFYQRLHKTFIEPKPPTRLTPQYIRKKAGEKILVYVITAFIAFCFYWFSFNGWMNAGREYHGLAFYGAHAPKDRPASETSGPGSIREFLH